MRADGTWVKSDDDYRPYKLRVEDIDDGDSIEDVTWQAPPDVALDRQSVEGSEITVWVGGGVAGRQYALQCLIATHAGQAIEAHVLLVVKM